MSGRARRSSGRVVPTVSSGTSRTFSTSVAKKASMPSLARWRSSMPRTAGESEAMCSRKRSQAANSLRERPLLPRGPAAGAAGRRATRSPRRRAPRRAWPRHLDLIELVDAELFPDDLAQGPEGELVAVGRAAALTPAHDGRTAVDVAQKLEEEARLADAGFADDDGKLRLRGGTHLLEQPAQDAELDLAADEGAGYSRRRSTPIRETGPRASQLARACRLPLTLTGDSAS